MRKLVGFACLVLLSLMTACSGSNILVDPIQGGLNDSSGLAPVPVLHPIYTMLSPAHRARDVDPSTLLVAYFTLAVDTSTLNLDAVPENRNMILSCNRQLVGLTLVSEDAFQKKLVLSPIGGLPRQTFCQLRMTRNVKSVQGIPMDNEYIWEFFIGSGSDS